MLHAFLEGHMDELLARYRDKVGARPAPGGGGGKEAILLFVQQLVEMLRAEAESPGGNSPGHARTLPPETGRTAAVHGAELLSAGYPVDRVVHDYGDICQAVTELARDCGASITLEEYRILNLLLDNAIAEAVTSYERHHDEAFWSVGNGRLHDRIGTLAEEQRRLVDRALTALGALKAGQLGYTGATGTVLEESLGALRDLIDKSLPEIRLASGMTAPPRHP